MAHSFARFVVGTLTLGCLAAAACSAAPEAVESSNEALVFRDPMPICRVPRTWPYPYAANPNHVCEYISLQDWGTFDNTPFENQLVANGCSYAIADAGYGAQILNFGAEPIGDGGYEEGFRLTVCPDTCAIEDLVADYVGAKNPDGTLVDPYVAHTAPGRCVEGIQSGQVYVLWDPKCPGTCPKTDI